MQELLEKAKNKAYGEAQKNNLAFDPQGRVLVQLEGAIVSLDIKDDEALKQQFFSRLNKELKTVKGAMIEFCV